MSLSTLLSRRHIALGKSVLAGAAALAFIAAIHYYGQSANDPEPTATADSTQNVVESMAAQSLAARQALELAPVPDVGGNLELPSNIAAWLADGDTARARGELLQQALAAVEAEDQAELARVLALLGIVSLSESDTDEAEVYLAEALAFFYELDDDIGAANVYMQLGRLHLIERQRARRASDAYDSLLIARWKISQGQFYQAEPDLLEVVQSSMALKRYGAAASAWRTLYRGYDTVLDSYNRDNAGREAVRLHAASGQLHEAQTMLATMRSNNPDESMLAEIETEIDELYAEFENSVLKIGAARDYDLLYNQLQAQGDVVSAWRFRLQADASLAKVGSRALYRRQPDALVELYKSNSSMDRAAESLKRAKAVFSRYGMQEMVDQSNVLRERIY
jgi:tetratricopeptide (TPR) repeat protein